VAKALDADLRSVPYRGDAPVVQDVMAGQISAGIGSVGACCSRPRPARHIVAVNGSSRLPLLPEVPTYAELGIKGYEEMIFNGLFGPAGMPADLVQRYSAALAKVVKSEAFAEKLGHGHQRGQQQPGRAGRARGRHPQELDRDGQERRLQAAVNPARRRGGAGRRPAPALPRPPLDPHP
jgi:tripartite-type tricarboxylate transporter receptor subunit TctC